jgi:hypothetical protein
MADPLILRATYLLLPAMQSMKSYPWSAWLSTSIPVGTIAGLTQLFLV